MSTPRDRARDRLRAWKDKQPRGWTAKAWAAQNGWDGAKATRLFQSGPMLEELDDIERLTGLLARDLIARPDAAADAPLDATERDLLAWYRAASDDERAAVRVILKAAAARSAPVADHADARMSETSVPLLPRHARRRSAR